MLDLENTTMGLEVEFQGVNPGILKSIDYIPFAIHDDGSTRGPTYVFEDGGLPIIPQRLGNDKIIVCSGIKNVQNIGLEMVSSPMRYADLREPLLKLSDYLRFVPQTPRTSIHIHVDIANLPWTYVRNVLIWAYHLEAPLFRLACGGGVHRGERKYEGQFTDYRFCRPLSNPIAALWGMKEGPLILWDTLTKAANASEFVASWGRSDWFWSGLNSMPHYTGHRLHMINLVSALRYGTLEWRLFDAIYGYIHLFTDIVAAVHKLAYTGRQPEFEPMLLGTEPNVDQYHISEILGIDISPLWGKRWPKGCSSKPRHPHYGKIGLHPISKEPVMHFGSDNGRDIVPIARR